MFSFFRNDGSGSDEQLSENDDSRDYSSDHEEITPKSMADYYNDLEAIIMNIRDEIEHADDDPAFRHAAHVLTKVIDLCRDIESSMNPVTVMHTNSERSRLLKTLGPDGLIEIKGEASRLLAIHYKKLMIALANKEYWPNPPILFAPLVHARYESELEKRAEETQRRIEKYQERIDAYDKLHPQKDRVELQSHKP